MAERDDALHEALGAILSGQAGAEDRIRAEAAMAADDALSAEMLALGALAESLRATAPLPVPDDLEARMLAAVAAEQAPAEPAQSAPEQPAPDAGRNDAAAPVGDLAAARGRREARRGIPAWAAAAAAVVVGAIGAALGAGLGGSETTRVATVTTTAPATEPSDELVQPGEVERDGLELTSENGAIVASARISVVGPGRYTRLRTSGLPQLDNASEFYELWFVSADGKRRVPAGTFHPDTAGDVDALFFAAADPEKLPVLAVTREQRDGDARPTLPDVLRSDR